MGRNVFLSFALVAGVIKLAGAQGSSGAQQTDEIIAPKYSNEFLSIGVGARALAMANSLVASADDVTASYWNPAGLSRFEGNLQLALMHNQYFAGIANYDYAALAAKPDATSTIAFTPLLRFGIDKIPDTTELIDANGNINYDRIKSFSAADYAFMISYAKPGFPDSTIAWLRNVRLGASVKVIHRKVGGFASAWGFGIDLGAQYDLGNWMFGAMARDITTTFNAWSFNTESVEEVFKRTGNKIPENSLELTLPKLLLGAGRKVNLPRKFSLYAELNMDLSFDGMRNVLIKSDPISIDPHMGVEIGYGGFAFLRAGVGNIQDATTLDRKKIKIFQPNMGLGVKIKTLTIDYALTNIGQAVGLYSNVFSLKLDINKKGASAR